MKKIFFSVTLIMLSFLAYTKQELEKTVNRKADVSLEEGEVIRNKNRVKKFYTTNAKQVNGNVMGVKDIFTALGNAYVGGSFNVQGLLTINGSPIVGLTGAAGAIGATGPTGAAGATGATGSTGAA